MNPPRKQRTSVHTLQRTGLTYNNLVPTYIKQYLIGYTDDIPYNKVTDET